MKKLRMPTFHKQTPEDNGRFYVDEICHNCGYEISEEHEISKSGKTIKCPKCRKMNAICSWCSASNCNDCNINSSNLKGEDYV